MGDTMASNHGYNSQTEPAKMEQIITEFFAKSLHIVLESRCSYVSSRHYSGEQVVSSPSSSSSSSSSVRPRDKWFNLALRECPAALENIDFWRQSILEPMGVDVILVQKPLNWNPMSCSPRKGLVRNFSAKERYPYYWHSEVDDEAKNEKIIERWIVHYESRKTGRETSVTGRRLTCNSANVVYKKSILLLRSLYVTVRLLPAYKLFRDLNLSGQIGTYTLTRRVSSFVEPFTQKEESDMQRYAFTPVDTQCGRLCVSVLYCSSLSDASSETSTPMSPKFIPDYVGSPLADPLKRLPSLPAPQCSPSSTPVGRGHSWSYELGSASPTSSALPSPSPSPSPTYSESLALTSKVSSPRFPPTSVPRHLHESPQLHAKQMSIDDWPYPTISPSPSPSPPTYIIGSRINKFLPRSESTPLSIPTSKLADTPFIFSKQTVRHSPPVKSTRAITRMDKSSASAIEKLFSMGKAESGKLSAVKILFNKSPQKPFSRSSSRLSFEDNFDDSDFSVPFVLDDDEISDQRRGFSSFGQMGKPCEPHEPGGHFPPKKLQDAAVSALIMLKKAPPLRQDLSESRNSLQSSKSGTLSIHIQEPVQISAKPMFSQAVSLSVTSFGISSSKTTADALQELRGYKEMKVLLLKQGGSSQTG